MAEYIDIQGEIIFNPSIFANFSGFLAFLTKIFGYLLYIFGLTIIIVPELRNAAVNWAYISLILGYLVNKVSKIIYDTWGAKKLTITDKNIILEPSIVFRSIFGGKRKVSHQFILHYERHKIKLLKFLPAWFSVYTTDAKFVINPIRWNNPSELQNLLDKLENSKTNIYVRNAYHKNTIRNSLNSILRTTQGKIGMFIIVVYTIMTIIGGIAYLIAPPNSNYLYSWIIFNPDFVMFATARFSDYDVTNPPDRTFWFGTDFGGRDIFSRMIFGTTITMTISIIAAIIITLLISIIGITTAIYGGIYDDVVTRLADVLLTFPQVVWIVLISVFSTPFRLGIPGGFYLAVYVGMSLVMWPFGARLVRSEVLEALNAEYVQAVELVGAKRSWIIRKHIFPKVIPTIFLLFFYQLTDIVIGISLLGYLGFGSESTIVWGSDLSKAFIEINQASDIQNEWWTILFPSIFIFGIVLGLTLFSDALRDVYASKYRGGQTGTLHSSFGGSNE